MADNNPISEEIKDLQSSVAINLLSELQKQGKITADKAEGLKQKFTFLHDSIVQSFQNHKTLYGRTKRLKQDTILEKGKLDQAKNAETINQEIVEELRHIQKKAETELDVLEHKAQVLEFELQDLEHEKVEKQSKYNDDRKDLQMKYQPKIDELNMEIKDLKEEITKRESQTDFEQRHLVEIQEKIKILKKENEKYLDQKSKLHEELLKIKEEPIRHQKKADMLANAAKMMSKDLDEIKDEITKKEKVILEQTAEIEKLQRKHLEYEQIAQKDKAEISRFGEAISILQKEIKEHKDKNEGLAADRVRYETELKSKLQEFRRISDNVSSLKKLIEQHKKEYKKEEHLKRLLQDHIKELEIQFFKIDKEENDIKFEMTKQGGINEMIDEETKILTGKLIFVKDSTTKKNTDASNLSKKITEYEEHISKLQNIEQEAHKTVKNLTALRESMARKASSAMMEVKETREELKMKELLILDLTKKQQETEFKLNNFKALYEEVKSARNKYVNMIQSSSQDLAELKERIKSLMNELEILKNESAEKDRTLMEYKHILQAETQKRDKTYAKLNKFEYTKKQKKEIVDQQINEIEKQHMVIQSLEREMLNLRHQYEVACENRNYTGIQLIDRNDELCILYEKSNIQENILRNGEKEIQALEDDIRMIKIEISEIKRKIEVGRKNIPLVPQLADQVIQLKTELNAEKDRERKLAQELENPQNGYRWRNLGGEDPDQEALEAKIQVLEERINNKKEQLLEKELILDEITNLSEKLRTQALEGRQTSLELSEKLNEFKAREKDMNRKMMATISELSMFQATAMKLEQEKEQMEVVYEEALENVNKELAPIPEDEIEYQKMVRDKLRYQQEREIRLQQEMIIKSMPPFAIRTTADHRVQQYIPDGDLGLPKPYGNHAPFMPSDKGTNMRHIKKPKPREIEI